MIFAENLTAAIEEKWTEGRYPSLRSWLGATPSVNRTQVADHWLELIGTKIGQQLDQRDFQGVVNQMIHRAASACIREAAEPVLIYQCFALQESKVQQLQADLADFHARLGSPATLWFYVLQTPAELKKEFESVLKQADQSAALPAAEIRAALNRGSRFVNERLIAIG
ncbi:MAG: hypothetical protein ACAI37_24360 [Chthoniobacter sp.]